MNRRYSCTCCVAFNSNLKNEINEEEKEELNVVLKRNGTQDRGKCLGVSWEGVLMDGTRVIWVVEDTRSDTLRCANYQIGK